MVPEKQYQDLIEKLQLLRAENEALRQSLQQPEKTESRTKEILDRYINYFNHSLDSIFVMESIYGVPNQLVEVNDTFSKLIGYNRQNLLDMEPLDLFAAGEKRRILNIAEELLEKKELYFNTAFKNKKQPRIPVEITLKTLDDTLNPQIIAIARNIEKKKQALKNNSSATEYQRKAIAGAQEIIVHINARPIFRFQYISQASKKILGFSPQELYDDPDHFLTNLHPEDYKKFMRTLDQPNTSNLPRTYRFLRKDQKLIWLEIYLSGVNTQHSKGEFDAIIHDVTHRQQMERTINRKLKAENLITNISTSFIEYSSLKKTIRNAVHDIGVTFNIDQIELCIGLQDSIRNQYVWQNPSRIHQSSNEPINLEATQWVKSKLKEGTLVYISETEKIPATNEIDIEYLAHFGIKSLLVSPLRLNNKTFGYLAFIQTNKNRDWDRVEIHLVNTCSSIFNAALRKELILERKDKIYQMALKAGILKFQDMRSFPQCILTFNSKGEITGCLGEHTTFFNADQAVCENKSFNTIFPRDIVSLIKTHYVALKEQREPRFFKSQEPSISFGMFFYKENKYILCLYNTK